MAKKTIPAISIIIPMYNVEKYVGECLDSILAQTFDDYEVIVVDDCSKDNGCSVVESYIPKFKGRLQLVRSKVNSGGAGTPRNIGLGVSRGEYLFFMDSDDTIVEDALEKIYKTAIKFHADVLHCGKWYKSPEETALTDKKKLEVCHEDHDRNITVPTLESKNLEDRIKNFVSGRLWWVVWNQIIKRDFIAQQNFNFSTISPTDDFLSTFQFICSADNLALLPEPYYVWRKRTDSLSQNSGAKLDKFYRQWTRALTNNFESLNKIMKNFELFSQKPQYRYEVFEWFFRVHIAHVVGVYVKAPAYQLDILLRQELEKVEDTNALAAFLFGRMNVFNVNLLQQQNVIRQQQAQIQQLQARLQQSQNSLNIKNEDIFKLN